MHYVVYGQLRKKEKGICLGGDKSGPTKNPPDMQIDEYYYLDKKYKLN